MQPARILDCHAHIIDPVRFPLAGERATSRRPTRRARASNTVDVLDRHGVHGALLVQLSGYGADNSVLVDAMQRHPHRFKAIGVVDDASQTCELEVLVAAGLVGVRFNLVSYDRDALARPESLRLLQRLCAFGLFAQVFADDDQWPDIAAVARQTGVKLLVDHFGIRNLAAGTKQVRFSGRACPRARWDWPRSSSRLRFGSRQCPTISDLDPFVEVLLRKVGPGNLMWGSDWPFHRVAAPAAYADTMAPSTAGLLPADDRDQVLWRTPARLFGFEDR